MALVPDEAKLQLLEVSLSGSLEDLYAAFVEHYEGEYQKEVRRILDLRWTAGSNMQHFILQKLPIYKNELGMKFNSILAMLKSDLGEQRKLLEAHAPKKEEDLKKLAALYDRAEAIRTSEKFRSESISRIHYEDDPINIEELDPLGTINIEEFNSLDPVLSCAANGGQSEDEERDRVSLAEEPADSNANTEGGDDDDFQSLGGSQNGTLVSLGKLRTY